VVDAQHALVIHPDVGLRGCRQHTDRQLQHTRKNTSTGVVVISRDCAHNVGEWRTCSRDRW
jgi:hypothetical protein